MRVDEMDEDKVIRELLMLEEEDKPRYLELTGIDVENFSLAKKSLF